MRFPVGTRAESREQNRNGGTDRNAHDDGQRDIKAYGTRYCKRLKNADRGRGALNDAGENNAEGNTEDRVREGGEHDL